MYYTLKIEFAEAGGRHYAAMRTLPHVWDLISYKFDENGALEPVVSKPCVSGFRLVPADDVREPHRSQLIEACEQLISEERRFIARECRTRGIK